MRVRTIGYSNFSARPMEGVALSKIKAMADHTNKPLPGPCSSHHH